MEVEHSQAIISSLLEAVIKLVDIPIEISKLEGDAIFLYAIKDRDGYSWDDIKKRWVKIISLF